MLARIENAGAPRRPAAAGSAARPAILADGPFPQDHRQRARQRGQHEEHHGRPRPPLSCGFRLSAVAAERSERDRDENERSPEGEHHDAPDDAADDARDGDAQSFQCGTDTHDDHGGWDHSGGAEGEVQAVPSRISGHRSESSKSAAEQFAAQPPRQRPRGLNEVKVAPTLGRAEDAGALGRPAAAGYTYCL